MNPEATIDGFLRRARRRYLTRELLGALGASAAASLLLEYGMVLADRWFGLDVTPVSIGPALLLVASLACLRRSRILPVAARADEGLRLKDRLVTVLDFRARTDIGDDLRRLQGRETAAALAGVDLARGIRVPRLLLAGPLLFGWMLYVDYFAFFLPFDLPVLQHVVRVVAPHRVGPGSSGPEDARESTDAGGPREPPKPPEAQSNVEPGPAIPPPEQGEPDQDAPDEPGGPAAVAGGEGKPLPGAVPGMIGEPARLYSDPVGTALTPVAADASRPGPAAADGAPELPLRGRISFNLVPVDAGPGGPAGTGTGPGAGRAEGMEITVDYDAIPPEFRPQVRRYFNTLVGLFRRGTDGT